MKKLLVSGGLGYIGSHVVVELQNNNFDVIIIDDLSNSSLKVLDGIKQITGVEPLFEKIAIDFCSDYDLSFSNVGDQNNNTIPEKPICDQMGIKLVNNLGDKIQFSSW